jgi:hypothetical protein
MKTVSMPYAEVVDYFDPALIGLVSYFPDADGDLFGMLVEFDDTLNIFYLFIGNDTDLYGRYWELEGDEEPTGNGNHFRAAADTLQATDTRSLARKSGEQSLIEKMEHKNSAEKLEPMFNNARVQSTFKKLRHAKQKANQ